MNITETQSTHDAEREVHNLTQWFPDLFLTHGKDSHWLAKIGEGEWVKVEPVSRDKKVVRTVGGGNVYVYNEDEKRFFSLLCHKITTIIQNKKAWYVFDEENGKSKFNPDASFSLLAELINKVIHPNQINSERLKEMFLDLFGPNLQFFIEVEENSQVKETSFLKAVLSLADNKFIPFVLASQGNETWQLEKSRRAGVTQEVNACWKKANKNLCPELGKIKTVFSPAKIDFLRNKLEEALNSVQAKVRLIFVDDKESELEKAKEAFADFEGVEVTTLQVRKDENGQTNHQEIYKKLKEKITEAQGEGQVPIVILDLDNTLVDTDRALRLLANKLVNNLSNFA